MQIFYSENIRDKEVILEGQEATHCTKVLRKNIGDTIHVIDGKGKMYETTLESSNKKVVSLKINVVTAEEEVPEPLPSIAIGLIKNGARFEWFVEKAVEIGVREIYPLYCTRSERSKLNAERINKIIVSAMKQSKRLWKPVLHPVTKLSDLPWTGDLYLAHYRSDNEQLRTHLGGNVIHKNILIGPEGDFTLQEVEMLEKRGATMVNLGNSRLRTETAGIVALTLMNNIV